MRGGRRRAAAPHVWSEAGRARRVRTRRAGGGGGANASVFWGEGRGSSKDDAGDQVMEDWRLLSDAGPILAIGPGSSRSPNLTLHRHPASAPFSWPPDSCQLCLSAPAIDLSALLLRARQLCTAHGGGPRLQATTSGARRRLAVLWSTTMVILVRRVWPCLLYTTTL